jgi:isoquinoline 1-oxidoreductase beta subunit
MGRVRTIARRSFLIGSAAILGGVAFGAYFVTRPIPNPLLDGLAEGDAALTPFVKITPQGITLIVPRADVGQGIASTQAMLIAEELDIDPATATLDPGQPHQAYFNATVAAESLPFPGWEHGFVASTVRDLMGYVARLTSSQFTGGSSSTADLHETLRLAGATARETLKAAAAARTGVPRADLRTEDGQVVLPDGTRIPYTELAGEAAAIEPVTDVTLRPASEWTRLGKPYQRLDIVAKSTGTQDYGIDVVLPGMLHATVRANPGRGGAVASYSADAALAMQGVRSVVEVNEGLAVIADNTWFAFKAAEALEVAWLAPDYPASSAEMWQVLTDAHTEEFRNSRLRDDGDVEAALNGATVIAAEYRSPFLAHAALEPLSATVLVEADRVHDLDRDAGARRGARRGG